MGAGVSKIQSKDSFSEDPYLGSLNPKPYIRV